MDSNTTTRVSGNELLKAGCPTLAGTILPTLRDPQADRFSEEDTQFLKFHGIYQQDDRDLRKTGKKYIFMVRLRLPGGVMQPAQYLVCDDLCSRHANGTLRITSRQGIQFHGVVKSGLGPLIQQVNQALLSTLAACGDVNRNVMAPPTPAVDDLGKRVRDDARRVALAVAPATPAYHSIWVDGVELNLEEPANREFVDPLYGKTYLPRKFKIGFAIPPSNDVDVLSDCCGFIAIADPAGQLLGYNLVAGGGMGRSHGNAATFPRLADVIGFLPADRVVETARTVLTIHRDFGDRGDRKHARLKYVLEDRGAAWFRAELESRLGFRLEEPKPYRFETIQDRLGWGQQADGRWFLGVFVQTGRIRDTERLRLKTGLRQAIERFQPEIRFTPANNVILANIASSDRAEIDRLLRECGLDTAAQGTPLARASTACVAFPTCGLALAESERVLPGLVERLEALLAEAGLPGEEFNIRMTGCPNGCVRPYLAELGFVGRAPGRYQLWLGGNRPSTRMARPFLENVKEADIEKELRPLFTRFRDERQTGEGFGDWCARVIWPTLPAPAGSPTSAPAS